MKIDRITFWGVAAFACVLINAAASRPLPLWNGVVAGLSVTGLIWALGAMYREVE